MKTLALALATAGLTLSSVPALAGDANKASTDISFEGIDFASEEGLAELDRRIDRAARAICTTDLPTGSRIQSRAVRDS